MKKIFIASSNDHKIKEIKSILNRNGIDFELVCPKDFNDFSNVLENGFSFKENAEIKARYYFEKYHLPTLADDSGICIDYFGGFPGLHSARFLNQYDNHEKNEIVLKMMKGVKNRKAHYICGLVYMDINGCSYYEGRFDGEISLYQNGDEGFGYDPIFYLPEYGKNSAEIKGIKDTTGHRYKALCEWILDLKKANY